jgi:hypothetical protein
MEKFEQVLDFLISCRKMTVSLDELLDELTPITLSPKNLPV